MRVQKSITLFTQQNTAKNPEITPKNIRIAGTDLNEDGINEFIISTQDCPPPKKMCSYLILADKGRSMISLGRIKARYLSLANTYSHGIRDIQAYDNEKNDFDYKLYVWEPASSHYTVKDERP
ncbi:MAG: hypothetical protein DHS20C02_02720 [Micavibrio sp.]|nr:MAG: hypothetical protein DHS20C02_02720 [Micavibrio sp.]